jgi:hypothetical protein
LSDLRVLQKVFMEPLQQNNILNSIELNAVFSNIGQVVKVSQELVQKLNVVMSLPAESQNIGEIFIQMMPCIRHFLYSFIYFLDLLDMKVFLMYCSSHGIAKTMVANLKLTNPRFTKFLENAMLNPECQLLEFDTFLIKPLHRVTRYPDQGIIAHFLSLMCLIYPLLIRELLKHTLVKHKDYVALTQAHRQFQQLVAEANERKRSMEYVNTINVFSCDL